MKSKISAFAVAVVLTALVAPQVLMAHEGREVGSFEVTVGFLNEPALEGLANGATIKILKPGIDIESHGALFSSGTVAPGGNFEFEFDHELEDLVVPFHDHLTGNGGTVTVTHDAESSATVMVQFTHDGFSPSDLRVQAGTTVMFMNASGDEIMTVLSGLHDATGMADEHDHADSPGQIDVPVLNVTTLQVEVIHVPTGASRTMELRPVSGEDGSYVADFIPTAPGAYTFRFFGTVDGEPFNESFTSGPGSFDEIEPARSLQFPYELRETRELQGAVEGMQSELDLAGDTATNADSVASTALIIGLVGLVAGVFGTAAGGYGILVLRRRV